jgi:hypothetical protein
MAEHSSRALVPQVVREVTFYDDLLLVALVGTTAYVALRPITDLLGLEWSAQYRRVQRDEVLAVEAQLVVMTGADGRQREMFSLPLEFLPGWLFGITVSKARPQFAAKLTRYRRDCFRVLWQAFQSDLIPAAAGSASTAQPTTALTSVPTSEPATTLIAHYNEFLSVTTFVREHLEILTGAVLPLSEKLDHMVRLLESLVGRQEATEAKVAHIDERTQRLTPDHARTVVEFVEQMVQQTRTSPTPLDHYKIYGMLKHKFRAASYKEIADERFSEVMDFLRDLLRRATRGALPQQESLF